jgi:aminodeoxyfutalosine synthase
MISLQDFDEIVAAGGRFSPEHIEALCTSVDLPSLGSLGEAVRKRKHGTRVTFVRVLELAGAAPNTGLGEAGEVRLQGAPATAEDARARVRDVAGFAAGVPLTGFSLTWLLRLAGGDHLVLAEIAAMLKSEGLEAIGEVSIDELDGQDNAAEALRALAHGGLGAWRAVVRQAAFGRRLVLIDRAEKLQQETGAFRSFAALPLLDSADQPSTGYDDVRTIALARLLCPSIPSIQVDWRVYGPKLAQVAITYGADDIDGVAVADVEHLGHRRSPGEEIKRQIQKAFAEPVERDGRYGTRQ